jgi:hypothetical protein
MHSEAFFIGLLAALGSKRSSGNQSAHASELVFSLVTGGFRYAELAILSIARLAFRKIEKY